MAASSIVTQRHLGWRQINPVYGASDTVATVVAADVSAAWTAYVRSHGDDEVEPP